MARNKNPKYPEEIAPGSGVYDRISNYLTQTTQATPAETQTTTPSIGSTVAPASVQSTTTQSTGGNQWYGMAENMLKQYQNMKPFSFNLDASGLYNMYKNQAVRQGQLAMKDTMGQAAGLTGGYGSSYAQNVGQQAYNSYLEKLNDKVPDIYALERSYYDKDKQSLLDMMNLYNQMGDRAYQQNRDRISDERYQEELAYGRSRDQISDARYEAETALDKSRYDQEQAYDQAMQLIKTGKMPSDSLLEKAYITDRDWALAMSAYYQSLLADTGVGSGGGSSGGGSSSSGRSSGGRSSSSSSSSNSNTQTTKKADKATLWSQISDQSKVRILNWVNGHPGNVTAAQLDEAFTNPTERQYMKLVYGV